MVRLSFSRASGLRCHHHYDAGQIGANKFAGMIYPYDAGQIGANKFAGMICPYDAGQNGMIGVSLSRNQIIRKATKPWLSTHLYGGVSPIVD